MRPARRSSCAAARRSRRGPAKSYASDSLRTGADGTIGVTLKDDTRPSLGPTSEVRLERFYEPGKDVGMVLRFVRGVAAYVSGRIAKLAPDSIRLLETPAAIVGVRGTSLIFRVQEVRIGRTLTVQLAALAACWRWAAPEAGPGRRAAARSDARRPHARRRERRRRPGGPGHGHERLGLGATHRITRLDARIAEPGARTGHEDE